MTFLFQVMIVHFAHKIEYKHLLIMSISGIALFLWLITLSSSFIYLIFLYLILRVFMSFYHPMGIAMVSKSHPDKALDFAMGVQSGSGNLGVLLAFLTVGYSAQAFGWKTPLLIWASTAIFFGLICYFLVIKTSSLSQESQKVAFSAWFHTFREMKTWIPGFAYGGACWGATVYYAPSLLNHKFLFPMGKTGIYMAIWIALGTIMPYSFGFLCRKFGRLNIALLGFCGSAFFLFCLGVSPHKQLAVISLLFFGAFLFLIYPALQSFVGSHFPESQQVLAFSLVANIQMLSGAIFNLFAGFMSYRFGINSPFIFLAFSGVIISSYYFMTKKKLET
jgi:MFS family permease